MPYYTIIKEGYTYTRMGDEKHYHTGDIVHLTPYEFTMMPIETFSLVNEKVSNKSKVTMPIPQPEVTQIKRDIKKDNEIEKVKAMKGMELKKYAKKRKIKFGRGCIRVTDRKQKLIEWIREH